LGERCAVCGGQKPRKRNARQSKKKKKRALMSQELPFRPRAPFKTKKKKGKLTEKKTSGYAFVTKTRTPSRRGISPLEALLGKGKLLTLSLRAALTTGGGEQSQQRGGWVCRKTEKKVQPFF